MKIYRDKDTGYTRTEAQMRVLWAEYVNHGIIDDYGYADFIEGATDRNGQYEVIEENYEQ